MYGSVLKKESTRRPKPNTKQNNALIMSDVQSNPMYFFFFRLLSLL